MRAPLLVQEGNSVPVSEFLALGAGAEDRDRFRGQVRRLGKRLRRELSLREVPLVVEDLDDGPALRVRGFAGTLRIAQHELDVAPKHVLGGTEDWRAALVIMLERGALRRGSYARSRRLQLKHRTFVDQFAYGFGLGLEDATQHAPIRTYVTRTEELPQLRGRLLVAAQLRSSLTRPHRLIVEVDALDADNPTNRLLHWVGRRLLSQVRDAQVRRFLSYQLGRLPAVSEPVSLPAPLVAALPRQYAHYTNAVQLALAYARGRTTFPGVSDVGGAGFVVGTERLFESFVERTLIAVCASKTPAAWHVRAQASEPFAEPESRGRRYWSRPDNIVDLDSQPVLIVDAKYKQFRDSEDGAQRGRPANGDLYQMTAASVAHACTTALLVYPRLQSDDNEGSRPWDIRWWRIAGIGVAPLRVGAVTIDLSLLDSPRSLIDFDAKVSALLDQAVAGSSDGTGVSGMGRHR